ncbi:MAG: helix-turn-helix domain-containing protein [Chloroflexota bacterium]|nr:helix-turn-helix domain-containing protein [Actinomycetota bacterium]MDP9469523.1 helix-turn-helix domain-containing protein [Chloroflexota bacterium]
MDKTHEFARTLRGLARLAGKSERELAGIAGIDDAYVRRLMTGEKANPSPATVIRLAIALVACPDLIRRHPTVADALPALMDAMLNDAAAKLPEPGGRGSRRTG